MHRVGSQASQGRSTARAGPGFARSLPCPAPALATARVAAPGTEGRRRAGREDWLARHAPLVKRIAHHLHSRLPANVEIDDLVQAGMIGLLDAIERYAPMESISFETYASQRIRGAMLDELRACDWLPRSVRKAQRSVEAAVRALEQRLGRAPAAKEIARELGLTLAAYHELLAESRGGQVVHFDDLAGRGGRASDCMDRHLPGDGGPEPGARLAERRFREALVAGIEGLPAREKLLMSLYYEEDLNFREIAAVLRVTESRVCQLHAQVVARLRARLRDWWAVPAAC